MSLYSNKTYIEDLDTAIESSVNLEKLSGRSVLITGATGTIGSFLVDLLQRYNAVNNAEIRIYACGRNMEKLRHMFKETNRNELFYQIYDSHNEVTFDFHVDYIIHAAGNAYPAAFNTDPVGTIIGNISGTYNLLEYARKFRIKRFLYISSGEVYGQGDLSLEKFDEEYAGYLDPLLPRSCYPNEQTCSRESVCIIYKTI